MPATVDELSVESYTNLAELQQDWLQLQNCISNNSLFLRYEWFDAALQWRSSDKRTAFLRIHNQQKVSGICAMQYSREKQHGVSHQSLGFVHMPDTQLSNLIASDEDYSAVASAIARYLKKDNGWDTLRLGYIPFHEATRLAWSNAFAQSGMAARWSSNSSNPYVQLQGSWADFYATRSRRLKKGNNLIANKLKKAHQSIEVQWLYGNDVSSEQWQSALAEAKTISANSWKRETVTTLNQEGPQAFIDRLSKHAIKNGWLSLWLLRLDNVAVAMEYQIIYNGHVHALRADYDTGKSDLSPGAYLNWKLLERLFEQGLQQYEMGPGDNPYKKRWLQDSLPLDRLTVYNNTIKGRLLKIIEQQIKPLVKKIFRKPDSAE